MSTVNSSYYLAEGTIQEADEELLSLDHNPVIDGKLFYEQSPSRTWSKQSFSCDRYKPLSLYVSTWS
jgi:hypothetical protein